MSTPPNASTAAAKAAATASSDVTSPPTADAGVPEPGDGLGGALGVEVERRRRRRPPPASALADRAADAARGAGDERDLALQLAGRRRQRELVELERPVLDREALARVERDEAAERVRAGHDLDRAVVEVARQPRRLRRRAGADEADVLDRATTRASGSAGTVVSSPWPSTYVAVLVAVGGRALADARAQRRRRRRPPGRTGSTAARAWCARGGPGRRRRRRSARPPPARRRTRPPAARCRPPAPSRARSRRAPRSAGQHVARARRRRRRHDRGGAAEARRSLRALVDERDGPVDHVDRAPVGLLGGVAPDDEPVLGQHDELEPRVLAHGRADLAREREARADVRDPGRLVAEALGHQPLAVRACPPAR